MSDSNMHTTVRVDTVSDTAGIEKMLAKIRELQAAVSKLGGTTTKGLSDGISETIRRAQDLGSVMYRTERSAMADLNKRFNFERRMSNQRESDAKAAAAAEKLLTVETLAALREKMQFQSRMARQAQQEARDLAREQIEGVRLVARAEKEAARDRSATMKAEIKQIRDLGHERARAYRDISGGAGKVRQGVGRAAFVGAAGAAVVGAGARRGMDKLTKSGITIDESLTQAAIHIFGSQKPVEARKSAEALRKKLIPVATGLGSKTSDILGAYVEASQAGVDSDILDKVVGLGSKYAKMNKLALPKTLEETGYALQGLKSFGSVNDKTVSQYFNGMSYLVATTAANREQMTSFGKRGLSAGASVGMSMPDTLAFGAAATAAGAEGNQAARMLSSQGGRIAGWNMKAHDISRKSRKSDEDRLFLQAPSMMGFGNYDSLARKFKQDFLGTFADVQSGLKKIADPLKRRSIEKMLFGQEFGSLTDSMVMGGNLREYRNKLKSPEASNFIDQNWAKQTGSFGFIVAQIKSVFQNLSDSLGLALKPIYEDLRDFALKLPEGFDNFEQSFKAGLKGFIGGLGSPDGTMAGLLKQMFGNPADFSLNVKWIEDFSRGFGQGLCTVGDTVKGVLSIFTGGDTSAAAIGKITAQILGFSAALVVAAPVVAVLGGIGTALMGLAMTVKGVAAVLRGAGLMSGAGAAGAGASAARGVGAAAGAAGLAGKAKGGLLGKLGGALGVFGLADAAREFGILKPDLSKGWGRGILNAVDPAIANLFLGRDDVKSDTDGKGKAGETTESNTRWVDPPTHAKAQHPASGRSPLLESLDALRAAVTALADEMRNAITGTGGIIGKTTANGGDLQSLGVRMQLAALGKADLARSAASGTVGKVLAGSGSGIPYTPGAGGAGLSNNRPGQAFSIPGLGARYGVGGDGAGGSGSGVTDPRMSGDVRQRAQAAHDFFRSKGLSEEATAGILASMKTESNFTPTSRGDGGAAHGLFQHHADRRAAIMRATGINMSTASFGQQLEGAWWEMNHGDAGAQRALKILKTPGISAREAGGAFVQHFERPKRDERSARGALAEGMMRQFSGGAPAASADTGGGNVLGRMKSLRTVNEQCVSLAKAAVGSTESVLSWRRGVDAIEGTLKPGTPVATFLNRNGSQSSRYAGGGTGTMGAGLDHAGVFEKYLVDKEGKRIGMQIAEQYKGSGGVHSKAYWFNRGFGEHNASNYHAIQDAAGRYLGGDRNPMNQTETAGDKGFTSSGWQKASDLARQSPAEKLAAQAPVRPNAGATGAGRSSTSIAPVFNIHQAGNPEETANLVQRRIQDSTNYLSHDVSFESV